MAQCEMVWWPITHYCLLGLWVSGCELDVMLVTLLEIVLGILRPMFLYAKEESLGNAAGGRAVLDIACTQATVNKRIKVCYQRT
jgi:hypothetical protein